MSEILIQGTYLEGDNMNNLLRDPYGSNRSNRSGKSLSIFQDPNASQTLARDEEITYKMYDHHADRNYVMPPAVMSSEPTKSSSNVSRSDRGLNSSKLIMRRVTGSLAEGQKLSNGDPVELSGFIYHNGAAGSRLENDSAAKQQRPYTSHAGGMENKYSRHSTTANKATKAGESSYVRRSPEGRAPVEEDTISRGSSGFLFEGLSHLNGGQSIDFGEDRVDSGLMTADLETQESVKTSTKTTKTTTTPEGGQTTTDTQTTTSQESINDPGQTTTSQESINDPGQDEVKATRVATGNKKSRVGNVAIGMKSERKAGAFSMKPASIWPLGRSQSNTSERSDEFKASLDDTLSRKIKAAAKATSGINGDDGTFADTESINTSRRSSMQKGASMVSRSVSTASRASQKSGVTDGSSIPEDGEVRSVTEYTVSQPREELSSHRSDSIKSDLSRLVQEEDHRNSVSRSSSASQTVVSRTSSASRDQASGQSRSGRSSSKRGQVKNEEPPVGPISNGESNARSNDDTIDRLVREERARDKRQSLEDSSVATQVTTTSIVTTTQTVGTDKDWEPRATRDRSERRGDREEDIPVLISKSSSEDYNREMDKMGSEKGGKEIQTKIVTEERFGRRPEDGISWFASSSVDPRADPADHSSSSDAEQNIVHEEGTVVTKTTSIQSDPFSNLDKMTEREDKGVITDRSSRGGSSKIASPRDSIRSERSVTARSPSQSQTPSASVSRDTSFQSREAGKLTVQSGSYDRTTSTQAAGKADRRVSPAAAAVQTDEFKSKLTAFMNGSPAESSSARKATAPGKNTDKDLSLKIRQEPATNIHGESSSSTNIQSSLASHDGSSVMISSASPTSPSDEAKIQVREGTVGKIKHAFKDIALTGGLAPSTLERKRQTDTSGTESDTGTKKYKFAIEGIDVPSRDTEESQTDTAPSTLTRDGKVGTEPQSPDPTSPITSPITSAAEPDTSDADTLERKSLDRKKKGFSYLPIDLGSKLAGEIKRRADTVQASKPHEGLEAKKSKQSQFKTKEESRELTDARAKLQHKDLFQEIGNRKRRDEENESDMLKEARAKLSRRQLEISQTRQMAQPHAPPPIQAHMLLAQKAKLQKRSEANLTSEASSEVSEAESNKDSFEAKSRSKLPSQKTPDPNRPLDESTEASYGNKLAVNTSHTETTIAKKDNSVPTDRNERNPDIPVISTHRAETKQSILRSVGEEKRTSQSYPAKPSEKKPESLLTPEDKGQQLESHVLQTSSEGVKAQATTEVRGERQQELQTEVDTPDSAYQSDAPLSPGLDLRHLTQTDNMRHPPVQEVEVRYARNQPAPSTSTGPYEASRKVIRETKSTTKTVQPAANGRLASNEMQKSKKTEYNAVTRPDTNINEGRTQMKTSAYMVTTNKGKQIRDGQVMSDQTETDRRDHVESTAISQEDIINAALSYTPGNKNHNDDISGQVPEEPSPAIYASPASPGAAQPSVNESKTVSYSSQQTSNKTLHTEPPQIKVTPCEEGDSNERQSSPETGSKRGLHTFFVPVTYEGQSSPVAQRPSGRDTFRAHTERAAFTGAQPTVSTDVTILNSSIPHKTGRGRRDSYNSTSTFSTQSSQDSQRATPLRNSTSTFSTQSSRDSQRHIPLSPLSVDVGKRGYHRPREMKTHPHTPSSRSPTRTRQHQVTHTSNRTSSQPKVQKQKASKTRYQNVKSESRSRRERIRDDHLEVNIYGEEDDDSSAPSAHSPTSRYQKTDESHSGRVPRYRIKDIHVRNGGVDDTIEYNSSVERSTRHRSGPHVSSVHLDGPASGDYVDYDSGSAYSEPNRYMGRSMGKYSIQKVMDRRGMNLQPLEVHPDSAYRKQKVYQVNRSGSFSSTPGGLRHPPHYDGTMRSNVHDSTARSMSTHAHTTDIVRSPEIAAVDPDLLAAKKTGTDYNVSLKLNAMQVSRPGSRMSWEHDELNQAANVTQYQNEYRNGNGPDQTGKHVSTVYNAYDDYNDWEAREGRHGDQGRAKTDDYVMTSGTRGHNNLNTNSNLKQSRNISRSVNDTREVQHQQFKQYAQGPDRVNVEHQQFKQYARGPDRVDIDIELAADDLQVQNHAGQTAFFHRNTKLRRSKSDPSMAKKFRNANLEPKFSMKLNQTMTMDYTPQEHEIDDNNNRDEWQRQRRPPSPESELEYEQTHTQNRSRRVETTHYSDSETDTTIDEDQVVPARKGMTERPPQQWPEDYFSPYDAASDQGDGSDEMPQVVRGSILIQNSIDPGTGGPHIIDVVDDDSDDDFVVDDNTNMFDRRYHATKNNPLYDSDNESPERTSRPRFTDIFQKTSTQEVNGYDEPEYGFDETVTKTTTYDVSAEGRGRAKGRGQGGSSSGSRQTVQKSEWEINKLLAGAPPDSIKQTINVEREEEEIMGPLPANHADGSSAGPDGLLNFDTVSEKVDLGMLDGKAQVAVKVRCERIVPIRGVDDMFKKSSVIVTRLIEIDLTATDERQRLYEHIMRNQNRPMITSGDGAKHKYSKSGSKLSTKDTFKLYKTFMGLAEADEVGRGQSESLKIDRKIDEERRPDLQAAASNGMPANLNDEDEEFLYHEQKEFDTEVLEQRLEDQLRPQDAHLKIPEPDTISYSSAAPSTHDLIY